MEGDTKTNEESKLCFSKRNTTSIIVYLNISSEKAVFIDFVYFP